MPPKQKKREELPGSKNANKTKTKTRKKKKKKARPHLSEINWKPPDREEKEELKEDLEAANAALEKNVPERFWNDAYDLLEYIDSKMPMESSEDEFLDPVKTIWETLDSSATIESDEELKTLEGEKLKFVAYAREQLLTEEKIDGYVQDHGYNTNDDDKIEFVKRYRSIRDYLIIRGEATEYAEMKAILYGDSKRKKARLGPAIVFIPNDLDRGFANQAWSMKVAGWVGSVHTNDGSKSLSIKKLEEGKVPEKLYILGHGSPGNATLYVGGEEYTGTQIAKMLIKEGLPKRISDIVILSCYGGKGTTKKLSKARAKLVKAMDKSKKPTAKQSDKQKTAVAQEEYDDLFKDPANFYTDDAANFREWNLPFSAELIAGLKKPKNKKNESVYSKVRVTSFTVPVIAYYNQEKTIYLNVGVKKEGFLSKSDYQQDPVVEQRYDGGVAEPVGPIQLLDGSWIDANKDLRKTWL